MNKLARLLPVVAGAGVVALSQITQSGTVVSLESTDIDAFGGAISGVAQTLFNVFTPMFPYLLMIVGAGVAIAFIKGMVVSAMRKKK